jgi:hypothetical protein
MTVAEMAVFVEEKEEGKPLKRILLRFDDAVHV